MSGLITSLQPAGLNLQILGYFQGTIDQFHLPIGDVEDNFKVGQKVKARILYDISPSTPPRFALSLADHVIALTSKRVSGSEDDNNGPLLPESYPVGTILESVKVIRVETERGLIVEVAPGLEGFVHVIAFNFNRYIQYLIIQSFPPDISNFRRSRSFTFNELCPLESWYNPQSPSNRLLPSGWSSPTFAEAIYS